MGPGTSLATLKSTTAIPMPPSRALDTRYCCNVFGSEKKKRKRKRKRGLVNLLKENAKTKHKTQKWSAGCLPISSVFILQWAGSYLPASLSVPLAVQLHGLWICAIQQTKETCCIGSNNNNNNKTTKQQQTSNLVPSLMKEPWFSYLNLI